MSYKFDFAVSAMVSAKVVEEMVRKAVEQQTGKKVSKVTMKVGTISRGFGPSESTEHVFDGCTVFFEPEAATGTTKTNESFDPHAR